MAMSRDAQWAGLLRGSGLCKAWDHFSRDIFKDTNPHPLVEGTVLRRGVSMVHVISKRDPNSLAGIG